MIKTKWQDALVPELVAFMLLVLIGCIASYAKSARTSPVQMATAEVRAQFCALIKTIGGYLVGQYPKSSH